MKKLLFFFVSVLWVSTGICQDLSTAIKQLESRNAVEAKTILEKLVKSDVNNPEIHFYLGKALLMLKDAENASEEFEKAIQINPNKSDYHFLLGQAYGMDAQNSGIFTRIRLAPKIKNEFIKAVELDSKNVRARKNLIQFYIMAPGIMGGSYEKAINEAKTLVTIDEKSGHYELAKAYYANKNYTSAEEEYKILESKWGNQKEYSGFYNDYGYMLIKLSRFDEAILKFNKQVALNPSDPNSYDSLGDGYKSAGKKSEAIAAYKKALELDPNFKSSKKSIEELSN